MEPTALEIPARQPVEAVALQCCRLGTVQGDGYALIPPAIPQRVDSAVAVNRVAIQTQLHERGQMIECQRRQLSQLVAVQGTAGGIRV